VIVSQVDLLDVDRVALECRANDDQVVICDPIREHVFVVPVDDNVDAVVLVVGFLQVLYERIVRLQTSLLTLLFVQVDDVALDQLGEIFNLLLSIHLLLLLLLLLLLIHLLLLLLLHLCFVDLRLLLDFYHILS